MRDIESIVLEVHEAKSLGVAPKVVALGHSVIFSVYLLRGEVVTGVSWASIGTNMDPQRVQDFWKTLQEANEMQIRALAYLEGLK